MFFGVLPQYILCLSGFFTVVQTLAKIRILDLKQHLSGGVHVLDLRQHLEGSLQQYGDFFIYLSRDNYSILERYQYSILI